MIQPDSGFFIKPNFSSKIVSYCFGISCFAQMITFIIQYFMSLTIAPLTP